MSDSVLTGFTTRCFWEKWELEKQLYFSENPPPRTFKPQVDSQLDFDILSQLISQTNTSLTTSFLSVFLWSLLLVPKALWEGQERTGKDFGGSEKLFFAKIYKNAQNHLK